MPDWLISIITAVVSGLLGAGGLAAWQKTRSDARLSSDAQQDGHTLALINALGASETEFRNAVLLAYQEEVKARRDLDTRLTTTQSQLTLVTLERDEARREHERDRKERDQLRTELDHAHQKIRVLEIELAVVKAQQETT